MDSTINPLQNYTRYPRQIPVTKSKSRGSFDALVREAAGELSAKGKKQNTPMVEQPVFVGQISKAAPTVSQVMVDNGQFSGRSWDIIHSPINRDKPYTKVAEGTKIFLNPQNGELLWGRDKGMVVERQNPVPESSAGDGSHRSVLGTLDGQTPTISHLLAASGEFDAQKWQILALPVNSGKDFRHIPSGATISIDPQTKELFWDREESACVASASGVEKQESLLPQRPVAEGVVDLSEAVREFIGVPYSQLDCYSLVVKGLKNIGVPYGGANGLYRRLTEMARAKGLPANAYLTGEGLVEATGSKVLYEAFHVVDQPERTAREIFEKMNRVLEPGQILSFSTPTRGHTGIVSRQTNGDWTFINSGRMDHPIRRARSAKEVGEEDLLAELVNWFQLARRRHESLTVTLGNVELAKVQQLQVVSPSDKLFASL